MSSKAPTREFHPRRAKSTIASAKQAKKSKDTLWNPNTTGMGALPVELLLLITSFLPGLPIPCRDQEDFRTPNNLFRSQALETLSLTCRSIRATVRLLLWQSIEVIQPSEQDMILGNLASPGSNPTPKAVSKALATQLVRKLETVMIREPQYAASVRTISVLLSAYSANKVYAEFLRVLKCLANLSTVQILQVDVVSAYAVISGVANAFIEQHGRIKNVRTLVLGMAASPFLSAFESVKRVIFLPRSVLPSSALSIVGNHVPMVEELELMGGNQLLPNIFFKSLAQNLPNLRNFPCVFPVIENPNMPERVASMYWTPCEFRYIHPHLEQMSALCILDFEGNHLTTEIIEASDPIKKAFRLLQEKKRSLGDNSEFLVRIWEGRALLKKIMVK